jgi:ketopantoate hydroxymethyltransferase
MMGHLGLTPQTTTALGGGFVNVSVVGRYRTGGGQIDLIAASRSWRPETSA